MELISTFLFTSLLLVLGLSFLFSKKKKAANGLIIPNKVWDGKEFISNKHEWKHFTMRGIFYCNQCKQQMRGFFFGNQMKQCKICGIIIHQLCRLDKSIKCKFVTEQRDQKNNSSKDKIQKITDEKEELIQQDYFQDNSPIVHNHHQFVRGNLPLNSICSKCQLICASYLSLDGYCCLWCQKKFHSQCIQEEYCQLDNLENVILRPREVKYTQVIEKQRLMEILKNSRPFQKKSKVSESDTGVDLVNSYLKDKQYLKFWKINISEQKQPILVIINKSSGGQVGEQIMYEFKKLLNPIQVIDLLKDGFGYIEIFKNIKSLKIIVGGGDGTVASVANYFKSCDIPQWRQDNPPISILPLGTGNDLSRALGWGGQLQNIELIDFLKMVHSETKMTYLDRWELTINTNSGKSSSGKKGNNANNPENIKKQILYNYCSFGLDAEFCLGFHQQRQKNPEQFKSQFVNKFIYAKLGAQGFLKRNNCNLATFATLKCDGVEVQLPETIQNLVFLNISSWAGGATNLWQENSNADKKFKSQRVNDKTIEVIGITSILHLGSVQIGIDKPLQICQGSKLEFSFTKQANKQPIQIDGEPFQIEAPAVLTLQWKDQVKMLTPQSSQNQNDNQISFQKITSLLDQAEIDNKITMDQKQYLLQKLLN